MFPVKGVHNLKLNLAHRFTLKTIRVSKTEFFLPENRKKKSLKLYEHLPEQ